MDDLTKGQKAEIVKLNEAMVNLLENHGHRTRLTALAMTTAACMSSMNEGDMAETIADTAVFAALVMKIYEQLIAKSATDKAIDKAMRQIGQQQPN